MFVAPYISPASGQMCKDARIGYVDFAGNCFISFDRIFISIEGKPNPFPQSRIFAQYFSQGLKDNSCVVERSIYGLEG